MSYLSKTIKCNILLIGKTGAGKSSFANYLFDTNKFATGNGEPVTGWEDNFQHHFFSISNVAVNVYDSVGLEPNNFERWTKELATFLSERQTNKWGDVKSANDIMHTLFYVVNGASARVEENEMRVLRGIRDKYDLSASVIITNCDVAKENELSAIEKKVKQHNLTSLRVCSVSRNTRGGEKKESFGKEPAIRQLLSASYEKVGKELTIRLLKETISYFNNQSRAAKAKIEDSDLSVFNLDAIESIDFDDILNNDVGLEELIPPEYTSYHDFLERFDVDYQGRDIMNETLERISNIIDAMDVSSIQLVRKMEKMKDDFEQGNIFEKVGAVFQGLGMVLRIKKTIKDGIDEMFDGVTGELRQQMRKVEVTFLADNKESENGNNKDMDTLRKHLGKDIKFIGSWDNAQDERQLDEEELLQGELSAVTFTVGCYTIRSAQRVYKVTEDNGAYILEDEVPANQEELKMIRESTGIAGIYDNRHLRMTHEISAKHNSDPNGVFADTFKSVCRAAHSIKIGAWDEHIGYIGTVKENASLSDENAFLFVLNKYVGSSFGVESWYKLDPSGVITKFTLHPYDEKAHEIYFGDIIS